MFKKKRTYILIVIVSMAVASVVVTLRLSVGSDDDRRKIRDFTDPDLSNYRVNNLVDSIGVAISSKSAVVDLYRESVKEPQNYDKQARGLLEMENSRSSTSRNVSELEQVSHKIDRCLSATHLGDNSILRNNAMENAAYFLSEFRKFIPDHFLSNYSSHCWKETFDVSLSIPKDTVTGLLGEKTFRRRYSQEVQRECLHDLQKSYRNYFSSDLVCLPKVFILGFPKCGSTFLWCFLEKLLQLVQNFPAHSEKEPHFWMRTHFPTTSVREPVLDDIGDYITNFISGIDQIKNGNKELVLMDGNPNLIFSSPRFKSDRDRLDNNCLLPVLLPHFLPKAKYIVVMRNPIKMLYSAFWFSCTCCHPKLSQETQLNGPDIFHDRVTAKIDRFNYCMTDEDIPAISEPCSLSDPNYGPCIGERLHLIDRCVEDITYDLFSPELPRCGKSRIERGLYYVHVRKWLSVLPKEKFYFVTLEEISRDPQKIAKEMFRKIDVPSLSGLASEAKSMFTVCASENTQTKIDYKNRKELHMRTDTEEMLQTFFEPFNALLADLLGDFKYMWK